MRFLIGTLALFGFATGAFAQEKEKLPPEPKAAPVATAPAVTPDNVWDIELSSGGTVRIQLRPDKAPLSVERIKTLTRQGFYNGLKFHRVIDGFMAQGGDPEGTGQGGSKLPNLKAEFNDLPHVRGAVAMARADDVDSANSQFYIMFMPRLQLDNHYTVFGRAIGGMDAVDRIARGEPPEAPTTITRAWIEADGPPPLPPVPTLGTDVPAAPVALTTPKPKPAAKPKK
jgi:peptidylprolyl isomerase